MIEIAPVPKFPTRTLVLMVLTLLSFVWFFWKTHQGSRAAEVTFIPLEVPAAGADGGAR